MLTVQRLQTDYGTIYPTKAGRDWSVGIQKRYNKSVCRTTGKCCNLGQSYIEKNLTPHPVIPSLNIIKK